MACRLAGITAIWCQFLAPAQFEPGGQQHLQVASPLLVPVADAAQFGPHGAHTEVIIDG